MTTLHCSFCGKSQHEVVTLIAGRTGCICDECTETSRDIVGEHRSRKARGDRDQAEVRKEAHRKGAREMRERAVKLLRDSALAQTGFGSKKRLRLILDLARDVQMLKDEE